MRYHPWVGCLGGRAGGRSYLLTGPDVLTMAEQAAVIGAAVGRPVSVVGQPREQAEEDMAASMDPALVSASLDYWARLVDSPEQTTGEVERLTGHPARTFRSWAAEHADDFRDFRATPSG